MRNFFTTLSGLLAQAKARARYSMCTVVLATLGAVFCLIASGFLIAALYSFLILSLPSHLALLSTSGVLFFVGLLFFVVTKLRTGPSMDGSAMQKLAQEAEEATHRIAETSRLNVRSTPSWAFLATVAVGIAVGLLQPSSRK